MRRQERNASFSGYRTAAPRGRDGSRKFSRNCRPHGSAAPGSSERTDCAATVITRPARRRTHPMPGNPYKPGGASTSSVPPGRRRRSGPGSPQPAIRNPQPVEAGRTGERCRVRRPARAADARHGRSPCARRSAGFNRRPAAAPTRVRSGPPVEPMSITPTLSEARRASRRLCAASRGIPVRRRNRPRCRPRPGTAPSRRGR